MSDTQQPSNTITVSLERFKELEALEIGFHTAVEKAARELNNAKLAALREKDTPENARKRYKRHYETHKDEINRRRREAREAQKAMAAAAAGKFPESNASV